MNKVRLKYVTRFGYGDAIPPEKIPSADVPVFGSNGQFTKTYESNTLAPAIIIGRKGSYGKVNWSPVKCFASDTTFFIDQSKTQHDLRWLFYVLQTLSLDEGSNETAVPGLNRDVAYSLKISLPELRDQHRIAAYLDHETAHINALIAAKERLLALLAEKRQALITRAVRRGLDSKVKMKDSGVEWLGEVPEHWVVLHLKRVLALIEYGISESVGMEGDVAVLRMGDIKDGEIDYSKVGFIDSDNQLPFLEKGDLIFNRTNSLDQIGKVAIFRGNDNYQITFASYLVRFRCNHRIIPEYLNFLLNCSYSQAWGKSEALPAIGQANLNPNRFAYLTIPLPPLDDQENIVIHIKKKTSQLDILITAAEHSIALLKERRSALIAAAVTGRIEITYT